jgi:signal transduction histidine kinase
VLFGQDAATLRRSRPWCREARRELFASIAPGANCADRTPPRRGRTDWGAVSNDASILLSALPPGAGQKRIAAAIAATLLVGLLITLPLRAVQLPAVRPFIAIVDTVLFLNDFITAALLAAQFAVTRSRALLALACGYFFTSLIIVPHALTFPDLFAPAGIIGANLQSTVWLYIFWHLGIPPAVIAYALLKGRRGRLGIVAGPPLRAIAVSATCIAALVVFLAWLVTGAHGALPPIMVDAMHASDVWHRFAAPPILVLSVASIGLLWWRRSSVLDLWLLVVLWAWLIETALLSTTAYRYSFVWYAGRAFGVLSSCFVLLALLSESTLLYARLVISELARRREREGRMLTMDALSASMAHDINQPLGAIVANGETGLALLEREPVDTDALHDVLGCIVEDGHRAGEIVASIRSIFTSAPPVREPVDVDAVVRNVLAVLHGELQAHGIAVRAALRAPQVEVLANRGQLHQALLNLVSNAIDAMAKMPAGNRSLRIVTAAGEGGGVQISVIDTGPGVAPEIVERIFEPFFTTREQGSGMGLAICRSLVVGHGGRLWHSANESAGATFNVYLPASGRGPGRALGPARAPADQGGAIDRRYPSG